MRRDRGDEDLDVRMGVGVLENLIYYRKEGELYWVAVGIKQNIGYNILGKI